MLTLLRIAFTDFPFLFIPEDVKSDTKNGAINPFGAVKSLHGQKWKQQMSGKTLAVLCCHDVFTRMVHGVLAKQSFIFDRSKPRRKQTHTRMTRLTAAVNPLFTVDAKNSKLNPVSTLTK